MNARRNSDLLEATRLTRSGQLLEATALIQRALGSRSAPPPAANVSPESNTEGTVIEGNFRVIDGGSIAPDSTAQDIDREAADIQDKPETVTEPLSASSRFGAALREKLFKFRGPAPAFDRIVPQQAPEAIPEGAQFITGSYTNPAGSRSYKLYIPRGYEEGQPLPLVVMLHGCTQSPDDFAAGTRMNEFAEKEPCLVLYPAQSKAANCSKCWNWFNPSDQCVDQGEPSLIAGMTRDIAARYKVDPQRIYVAGLSAGGAMSATMAMTYPDLYAAAGIHSGLPHAAAHDLPSAFAAMQQGAKCAGRQTKSARNSRAPARPVPIIVFHGDQDTTVHPGNGDQVIAQFSPAASHPAAQSETGANPGMKVERGQVPNGHAYTRTVYRHPSGLPHVEQWTIHGADHAWSGGSTRGSYTDPRGPDATKEMMRFFLAHPLQ
ncbi:alpha/beta hydrolase family esterase [Azomonas macrocytogenes]|uniref:Poly(Hydroxyalkanoate) depolymerase family esterase n=1 Tax=Azomonas macrocytogenes TaxID=69962 RepID=A0A839T6T5_AZOMA|nr:PHB depolymerase family esterase [Azomonas macrocytogenes]MBB3105217.1 poly(hydroxyalkanoate) depolymerase family esterase [Azomonas macrocytogenes]